MPLLRVPGTLQVFKHIVSCSPHLSYSFIHQRLSNTSKSSQHWGYCNKQRSSLFSFSLHSAENWNRLTIAITLVNQIVSEVLKTEETERSLRGSASEQSQQSTIWQGEKVSQQHHEWVWCSRDWKEAGGRNKSWKRRGDKSRENRRAVLGLPSLTVQLLPQDLP